MTPGRLDIILYQGDTYGWRFVFWDDLLKTDPMDLTEVTPYAQIRAASGGAISAQMDCVVDPSGDGNAITMRLEEEMWATLSVIKKGQWDLEFRYLGGDVITVLGGSVTITADITRVAVP